MLFQFIGKLVEKVLFKKHLPDAASIYRLYVFIIGKQEKEEQSFTVDSVCFVVAGFSC